MNGRLIAVAGAAALVAVLMLVVLVEPSLAGTSQVGKNVGHEVKTWATALLLGVAALVAIPLLAKRDVSRRARARACSSCWSAGSCSRRRRSRA